MRPTYESEEDRVREKDAISEVCEAWGCIAEKLPMSYHLDFLLSTRDKTALGFAEVKCRNFNWGDHPDVIISLSKVQSAKSLEISTGLRTNLIIKCNNRLMWTPLSEIQDSGWLTMGGRTVQTRDNADVEPVFHIPNEEFRHVSKKRRT